MTVMLRRRRRWRKGSWRRAGRFGGLGAALLMVLVALAVLSAPSKAHALACTSAVTDIDFGSVSPLAAANTDVMGTVTVTCTAIPALSGVKICPGLHDGSGGSNGGNRLMTGPASTVGYQFYQDSARTQLWGAVDTPALGTVPAMIIAPTLTGAGTVTRMLYARLNGGQTTAQPGDYQSVYAGGATAFMYSSYLLSTTSTCTGFLGSAVAHPDFDVLAQLTGGCTMTTADLAFPTTGILAAAVAGQTTLRVTCTKTTPYTISLDNGRLGASPTARKMSSSLGDTVTYGIYRNAAYTQPWGAAASGAGASAIGAGIEQLYTLYGLVPAQTTPRPGAYTDRIVVTITY